jgi:DNA-binding transcriptional MocR family regulator
VTFVPGDAFYAVDPDPHTLRLNFSACDPVRLREGVARLAATASAAG